MKTPKRWSHFLIIFLAIFLLILVSGCKGSSTASSTANPTAPTPPIDTSGPPAILSGTLTYDYVPTASSKLFYEGTSQKPMRNVYLEVWNTVTNTAIGSTSTNDFGQYSISVATNVALKILIYAEMMSPPVVIQDNTAGGALYALATSNFTMSGDTVKNIRATSGWSGTSAGGSYTAERQAAPFAMLDSIYTISKKITGARASISLPQLKLNWSVNNISVDGNKALGQIGTSHYSAVENQLYILGQADVDSDEYDKHIIVHEWGHYFEANLSRSDSSGGPHGSGDKKDMSLAFGEGFGNALSAMAFDPDVVYTDTYGSKQQSGFSINMESGADVNPGWFSETSVQQILYDIYDSTNEAGDNLSLGIGPVVDVLVNHQKLTPAVTSIFSFVQYLKTDVPTAANNLNTLLGTKSISAVTSIYGTGETNDGGWVKNLPIYNSLTIGGAAVALSLYGDLGKSEAFGLYNTVFNNKYLVFTATGANTTLTVTTTDSFQIEVYHKGSQLLGQYKGRPTASAIGPFGFNIPTTAGEVYIVKLLTDSVAVYDKNNVVNLTVSAL